MHYVIHYEVASILFVLFILVYASVFYPVNSKKNLLFRIIAISVILTSLCDIVTAEMINYDIFISETFSMVANTIYFVGGTFLAYFYGLYIDLYIIPEDGKVILKKTKVVILVLLEINIILNNFTKVLFYFDEQHQYTHGKLYYLVYAGSLIFLIFVVISLFLNFKKLAFNQRIFGILLILLFIVPTLIQMIWLPDTLLMMFGAGLILLLNFFWLETPDYQRLKETLEELNNAQRQLEKALEETQLAKIEADAANNAKGQFLANMSHEIRTPINAVLGMDTMILRKSKDKDILKYAKDIQSAGKSLLSIINDILDFSKIESGKMELVPVEYNFVDVINDIYNMIGTKANDKDLIFEINIDETIPERLFGDDVRIRQILMNLLTNAVKYTPSGKVTLNVIKNKQTVNIKEDEVSLRFEVTDTGIGIKEEDIEKLTQKFVRIEESRNRNIEGTGLGINIVVSFLNMMGSSLKVNSVYGESSTFYFDLTQPIVNEKPIGNIKEALEKAERYENEYNASFIIPDCRLLVVDDNAMNLSVFHSLLIDMECQIEEADSGKKCLELVKENKYDIIFMDHMMPEMDGVETFHHMRDFGDYLNTDTPVVILTANAISGAKEAYLAEGFTDYLSKPIDSDKLEAMVGMLISDEKKYPAEKKNQDIDSVPEIEFPFIDGVDWKHALSKLKNEQLLMDSVHDFSVMAKSDMEMLSEMYEKIKLDAIDGIMEDVFKDYRIKVHSMKSNVATIGADHLAGLAKYLEYAAKDENLDKINSLMPIFTVEWNRLKAEVDEAFGYNADNQENTEEIDSSELIIFLDALCEAMKEADLDRADAVVEELSGRSFSDEQKKLFESLKSCVMNIDTLQCIDVIDKWKTFIS